MGYIHIPMVYYVPTEIHRMRALEKSLCSNCLASTVAHQQRQCGYHQQRYLLMCRITVNTCYLCHKLEHWLLLKFIRHKNTTKDNMTRSLTRRFTRLEIRYSSVFPKKRRANKGNYPDPGMDLIVF